MDMSRTAIERIKNIVIVVLMLSAILLLYFLWDNNGYSRFHLPPLDVGVNRSIQIQDVLIPEKIIINFGSENYTVVLSAESIWNSQIDRGVKNFIEAMKDMVENETISQSIISESDYDEVVKNRSIQAEFTYAIPLKDFGAEFGVKQIERIDIIDTFTTMAYSEASPESFFIGNKFDNKYYRLTVQKEITDFISLLSSIENRQNTSFYPLRTFAGVDNDTMLPLDLTIDMPNVQYIKPVARDSMEDSSELNDMAKIYFGESFDFTRKVTEADGTIVYVYSYGEKVLVIKTNGVFEYSSTSDASRNTSFFEALAAALDFITEHSEPGIIIGSDSNIYLKNAVKSSEGSGYRFTFGLKSEGYQVFYEESEPIIIEIADQKVVYSRFDVIMFEAVDLTQVRTEASPPFDILVEHYQYLYDILKNTDMFHENFDVADKSTSETPDVFNTVMENVSDVSTGYLRKTSGDALGELVPVWRIRVLNAEFYFNLTTAEPEGYKYLT